MSYYENMAAQLQSRIKRRGNHIAAVEAFKVAYHKLGQLKKFRETEADLEELRYEQVLDKDLLKIVRERASCVRIENEINNELMGI